MEYDVENQEQLQLVTAGREQELKDVEYDVDNQEERDSPVQKARCLACSRRLFRV